VDGRDKPGHDEIISFAAQLFRWRQLWLGFDERLQTI